MPVSTLPGGSARASFAKRPPDAIINPGTIPGNPSLRRSVTVQGNRTHASSPMEVIDRFLDSDRHVC